MLPTYHMNNFKPWAPPNRRPSAQHKSSNLCSTKTQNLPWNTLTPPKHELPARPPVEVCVSTNAGIQPNLSSSQCQPRDTTAPEPHTYPETPQHDKNPNDLVPCLKDVDIISCCELQDSTGTPTKPPSLIQGDSGEATLSFPSVSGSDDSLEEFFRLPDAQDDSPIDPAILAHYGSWENVNLQPSVPEVADSIIGPGTICLYPDPPPVLYSPPPGHCQDSSRRASDQNGSTQTSDHALTHDSQQLHPSQQGTSLEASYANNAHGNHRVCEEPKSLKRKRQQPDRQTRKRPRACTASPSKDDSFTAIRSHFVSLPLNDRLQFLSWLFEGALQHCMSDLSPTVCKQGDARATSCSIPQDTTQQIIRKEPRRSSRRGMAWSTEEGSLLLKLRKVEKRPWAEVTRLFSEKYPGRTRGAIQVYWSTTLSKKRD
ncbi:SANT/Myb-like DNA-binding domain-containing protein [Aspergillus undulatus]|uniref:SANT/Myb-like DNA-binding domain-containing protein n=1 Tax=Aspergillus undulatus TaxID=1810928 RepID=UPI003CCCE72F